MRVLVMGGGVVGVTTAYQLLGDGHEVALIERRPEVAQETSWGNAGMIAPGHSFVWSSPRAPWILLKSLVRKNQSLRFRPSADPRLWTWSLKFLAQCTETRARANTLMKHQLATYSQRVLQETVQAETLDYDRMTRGILYFYRDEALLDAGVKHMQILADDGQEVRVLDRAQILELEPAFAGMGDKIAGAIHCPTDESGDCNKFTAGLAKICVARGAEFHTSTPIAGIEVSGDEIVGVKAGGRLFKADVYVMALGCESPILARTIGVDLPIYPIKGYSLTVPVGNHRGAPAICSIDEHNLVAISRFGERVRITATAEFAGYDTSHKPADFAFMKGVVQELYPDGGDYERAEMWAGLRPMTPTNLPVFGRKRHRNLYYNTGHGHIGWTMAHGSARITADLIAARPPALSMAGLAA
jgi:D-amino-acid dehydrogenase